GETRHQRVACRGGLPGQRSDRALDAALQKGDPPPQVQAEIDRDLLVARASRVQPPSGIAEALDEQPLDEAVDVFVGSVDESRLRASALEDTGESRLDATRVV